MRVLLHISVPVHWFLHSVVFRDVKLLSFAGEDGDRSDEEEPVIFKKKSIVRPDREYASHLIFPGK